MSSDARFDKYLMEARIPYLYPSMINPHELIKDDLTDENEPEEKPEEKWVWIHGFKGTDANMCCRDQQYELGKAYEMDADVEVCKNGYHLCRNLSGVFNFYSVGKGNRFFEVSALVREKDLEKQELKRAIRGVVYRIPYSPNDKLAAKSIIFLRELSVNEVFEALDNKEGFAEWTEDDKKEALITSIARVRDKINVRKLIEVGYSEIFATYLASEGLFNVAYAVGSQPGLSMEMKCLAIFTNND